jgi:hypothetical protein
MRYATLLLTAMAALAATQARADIPEIVACANQVDPKLRLACFDAAVVKLKADVVQAEAHKRSLFGFTLPFGDDDSDSNAPPQPNLGPKEVTRITAGVSDSSIDGTGHVVLKLDNGQVWRIQDSTHAPLMAMKKDGVVIQRTILGGYYLSAAGQDDRLSAVRIQ